jgi:hypothetical protein
MTFPKAVKIEPLYQLPDGIYLRVPEKEGKLNPNAIRAEDLSGKLVWLEKYADGILATRAMEMLDKDKPAVAGSTEKQRAS